MRRTSCPWLTVRRSNWSGSSGQVEESAKESRPRAAFCSAESERTTAPRTRARSRLSRPSISKIAAAGKENMGFVLPRDCVIINPDSVGILRGAPNRAVAERFIEFCLSEAGQNLLMVPRGQPGGAKRFSIERMSLRPALYERHKETTLVPINPFAQEISFRYDPKKGGARWGIVNDLIGATIIDVHPELVAAVQRGATKFVPPVSEDEALRLAGKEWKDSSYRQRKILEWQRWAVERYRQ